MDPVSAFGLAVNIITVVDAGIRVAKECYEIYDKGISTVNADALVSARDVHETIARLEQKAKDNSGSAGISKQHLLLQESDRELQKLANETVVIAKELVGKLESLQSDAKPFLGRPAAVRKVWRIKRSYTEKPRIGALKKKLEERQNVLRDRHLSRISAAIDLSNSTTFEAIEKLNLIHLQQINGYEKNNEIFRSLVQQLCTLRASVETSRTGVQQHINQHMEVIEYREKSKIKRELVEGILEKLYFPTMFKRQQEQTRTHHKTFRWIFDEDDSIPKGWSSFPQWLRSDETLYWISGKLGSGKSTLMNFIYEELRKDPKARTSRSVGKPLIITFFFWRAGSEEQRSLNGLARAIIYQTLKAQPELLDIMDSATVLKDLTLIWTQATIFRIAQELVSVAKQRTSLVFLFDGLDEAQDSEISELIEFILELSKSKPCKICVSSRLDRILADAFESYPSLRLQDLTRKDTLRYVDDNLDASKQFQKWKVRSPGACANLKDKIVDDSQGVFLWVKLVTQKVTKGLANHESIENMTSMVNKLPTQMENVYEALLSRIEEYNKPHVLRYMMLMLEYPLRSVQWPSDDAYDSQLTCLDLLFVEVKDVAQIIQDSSYEELQRYCKEVVDRVAARCEGFLEVKLNQCSGQSQYLGLEVHYIPTTREQCNLCIGYKPNVHSRKSWLLQHLQCYTTIEFLHRSVYDFVSMGVEDGTLLYPCVYSKLDANLTLANTLLHKSRLGYPADPISLINRLSNAEQVAGRSIFEAMDSFDREIRQLGQLRFQPSFSLFDTRDLPYRGRDFRYDKSTEQYHCSHLPALFRRCDFSQVFANFGSAQYLLQQLEEKTPTQSYLDTSLCMLSVNLEDNVFKNIDLSQTLQRLLNLGADPNALLHSIDGFQWLESAIPYNGNYRLMTPWSCILSPKTVKAVLDHFTRFQVDEQIGIYIKLLIAFLEAGADRNALINDELEIMPYHLETIWANFQMSPGWVIQKLIESYENLKGSQSLSSLDIEELRKQNLNSSITSTLIQHRYAETGASIHVPNGRDILQLTRLYERDFRDGKRPYHRFQRIFEELGQSDRLLREILEDSGNIDLPCAHVHPFIADSTDSVCFNYGNGSVESVHGSSCLFVEVDYEDPT